MKGFKELDRHRRIAIILLGRPGSGKDTQANLLTKSFGLFHIVTSKLIEDVLKTNGKELKIDGRTFNILKERRLEHSGMLNTFTFASALVKNKIGAVAAGKRGLVMSGSPRSKTELKDEYPLLKKLYGENKIFIFHIDISQKEVYARNLKRRRRDLPELDTRKIIKKRLEAFNRYTLPVIKLLEKRRKIVKINGEQKVMKIHKDILKFLQSEKI